MKIERTTSFSGGMNDSAVSAEDFKSNQCALIQNGRIEYDGSAATLGGQKRLSASLVPGAASAWKRLALITNVAGDERLVLIAGQLVADSTDYGLTWNTVDATALDAVSGHISTANMQQSGVAYMLIANGGATVTAYDSTARTCADVTGVPSGIRFVAQHNRRLYAATGLDRTVYASAIDDFNTWDAPDGLVLPVALTAPITNIASAGGVLLVQTHNETAYIDGYGNSDIIEAAGDRGISKSVGCIAHSTFQACGDQGYAWLSDRGIEFWAGPGSQITQIGLGARFAYQLNFSSSDVMSGDMKLFAVYGPVRNEYWVWYAKQNAYTRRAIIVNLTNGAATTMKAQPDSDHTSESPPCAGVYAVYVDSGVRKVRPLVVTEDGKLYVYDFGTQCLATSTGAASGTWAMTLISRPYDFGEPLRRKWVRKIRVAASWPTGTLACGVVHDGSVGNFMFLTVPDTGTGSPRFAIARPSDRGDIVQVELQGIATISAIEVEAEVMHVATR